ncbi:MAG: hypothetical protein AB7Q17_04110 [Phycisphaerae bacterium]
MSLPDPNPVDVLIFIEHVARELDIACILAHELEATHGRSVAFASCAWGAAEALATLTPRVVALPYCYGASDPVLRRCLPFWPDALYVNLAFEQVFHRLNERFKTPRDEFAKRIARHHAWGSAARDYLASHGVPLEHIFQNGNPTLALYDPPYADFYPDRAALARRFGLDPRRRWVFAPENYAAAFNTDLMQRDYIQRGYSPAEAEETRAYARRALHESIRWWAAAAASSPIEVVVRPRPAVPLAMFVDECRAVLGDRLPERLHVIKHGSVREWIVASDVVAGGYTTTLIEAAWARKRVLMLRPLPMPAPLDADWYRLVPQVASADEFGRAVSAVEAHDAFEPLRAWARARVWGEADPLVALAEYLSARVEEAQRHADASATAARELPPIDRAPPTAHLAPGLFNRHEDDVLDERRVAAARARWAAHLRGAATGARPA